MYYFYDIIGLLVEEHYNIRVGEGAPTFALDTSCNEDNRDFCIPAQKAPLRHVQCVMRQQSGE